MKVGLNFITGCSTETAIKYSVLFIVFYSGLRIGLDVIDINLPAPYQGAAYAIDALWVDFIANKGYKHSVVANTSRRLQEDKVDIVPGVIVVESTAAYYDTPSYDSSRRILTQLDEHTVALWIQMYNVDTNNYSLNLSLASSLDYETAHEAWNQIYKDYTRPWPEPEGCAVDMGFWHKKTNGEIERQSRTIEVRTWEETSRNYPKAASASLNDLINTKGINAEDGSIILLHGEPGTGKTNCIRSLAWEWRKWARVDPIIDPETFLNNPDYLIEVMMSSDGVNKDKYRVVLLEDCGELIQDGARNRGQGVSRLLNMADGILGQGRKIIFLITTNEPIKSLDPAITRAGRCLSSVEIGKFPAKEASEWLGIPVTKDMTLAEMYRETHDVILPKLEEDLNTPIGLYI